MENLSSLDKVIRIAIALLLVILYLTDVISGVTTIGLFIVSGVLLITSITGFCPLYKICRINSKNKQSEV